MSADPVEMHICRTCSPRDWAGLRSAIEAAHLPVSVAIKEQDCMNGCARPVSVALQSRNRATYFFSDVNPDGDAVDIVATLRAYIDAPAGWIEDARPCGRLRLCLVGRVPAI